MKAPVILAAALLLLIPSLAPAADVKVSDMSFTAPEGWKAVETKSAMRKAQFAVGKDGEVVFYHFGAGGAGGKDANIKRWFRQFKEDEKAIAAKTEEAKAGDIAVTFVSANGTYLSGMPGQAKVEKPGHALLGAIIEARAGAIFVKFTGPKATVDGATAAFKTMVAGARPGA